MKKTLFVTLVALLVLCMFPCVSLAADAAITSGGTYDISAYYNSGDGLTDTLTINTTQAVTLTNTGSITAANFRIVCAVGGVSLTLSNVNLDDNIYNDTCPLTFTGSGNTLTLAAGTTSTLVAGSNKPAVCVESATELTICGSGTLITYGGAGGASIGGCAGNSGGTISFISSTVQATGCGGGAGIGGGISGSGGTIRITSGTVSAGGGNTGAGIGGGEGGSGGMIFITGGSVLGASDNGAGIGGGEGSSGGTVNISGGTVEANGGTGGAGIGGGKGGTGGIVNITNGTVTTQSVTGAGIGAGEGGGGCTVSICGGTVEAASGWGYDIGSGESGTTGGTLNLDGAASLKLTNTGTNASVTIGDCYILDSSTASPITDGAYINGALFTGTVIDVTDGSITGSGAAYSSPTVTISGSSYDYLIIGSTTSNRIAVSTGTTTAANIILFGTSVVFGSGCAFDMAGSNVDLELCGSNTLTSGNEKAGLHCPDGAILTISGNGSLTATGSRNSAGIGVQLNESGGSITIQSGTVNASGGQYGAGIGGGAGSYSGGSGGSIAISGSAIVTATGGLGGAGIGGGCGFTENGGGSGSITISGSAIVTATGGSKSANTYGGAGIGGGGVAETPVSFGGSGNDIAISGGTVTATGGDGAAGIGGTKGSGGGGGAGGSVVLSGGTVYAVRGTDAPYDIGDGPSRTGGTLAISGTAAVFLAHNSCIAPTITTHTHIPYSTDTEESYGYSIPSAWTPTFGSYLRIYTLSYNVNGGSGTAPASATQLFNTTVDAANGSGLSRTNYEFDGWNTAANGSGTSYAVGSTFTFRANATLYAKWKAVPTLASSVADGKIYTGGRITLTPNIEGGEWSFDSAYLSREGGTFTALKAGTSAITYTVEGQSTGYTVTITAADLPETGQDFMWVWVLGGAAALAAVTAVAKRRKYVVK